MAFSRVLEEWSTLSCSNFAPPTGSLLFSTYLGGSKNDGAYSVALDALGNPVLSGVTESDDFPSTYFGGSMANSDQGLGGSLGVDASGRVWLTGMTSSSDLPTRNAIQPAYGGGDFDRFLASFSPDGSTLCFSSYVGGMPMTSWKDWLLATTGYTPQASHHRRIFCRSTRTSNAVMEAVRSMPL